MSLYPSAYYAKKLLTNESKKSGHLVQCYLTEYTVYPSAVVFNQWTMALFLVGQRA